MTLWNWLSERTVPSPRLAGPRSAPGQARRSPRLLFEQLEDRIVPAALWATYRFQDTLNAEQTSAPALVSVDPLGLNAFESAMVYGQERPVYHLDGNNLPLEEQAGLVLDTQSLVSPTDYSVELVFAYTEFNPAHWNKILDVQNRTLDSGLYVQAPNQVLAVWDSDVGEIGTGSTVFPTDEFHHVVLTNDQNGVIAYLDGVPEFATSATHALDISPENLMSFFLDDTGTREEQSDARIALMRIYQGVLSGSEVATLAQDPFGLHVVASSPADGEVVTTKPTTFTLRFSNPVDPSTVAAGDLMVNGKPANSFVLSQGDRTATFTYLTSPVTDQGLQTLAVAAGAIEQVSDHSGIDAFTADFRYDAVLLQVTTTKPAIGSVITLPTSSLRLNFNERFDASSVGTEDLTLNQGTVTGFHLIDSDTVEYVLSGITEEGTLTVDVAAGALTDVYGNPGAAFAGSYTLDFDTVPFPTPLEAEPPAGSLIYDPSQSGFIQTASDTDSFTLLIDPGQKITLQVTPGADLRTTLELDRLDDDGPKMLGKATASGAGAEVILQNIETDGAIGGTKPRTYKVVVRGADRTTGSYTLRWILNAALEAEGHGGPANNTRATAQKLESSFLSLNSSGDDLSPERGAVLGQTDVVTTSVFSADFESGDQGFTVDNTPPDEFHLTGLWHSSIGRGDEPNHSANHSFYYGQGEGPDGGGTINVGSKTPTSGNLLSPSLTLPTGGTLELNFNDVLDRRGRSDEDSALLQVNDGSGWTTLAQYTDNQGSWTQEAVDLTAYAGRTVQLRWQFDTLRGPVGQRPEGWYIDDAVVLQRTPTPDYYAFKLGKGESATLALKGLSSSHVTLALENTAGVTLALGRTGATNVDGVISNFVATAAGTYYARVLGTSPVSTDYSLVVTRKADFNTEPNDTFDTAQDLISSLVDGRRYVLGHVTGNTDLFDNDIYRVTVEPLHTLEVSTTTPADHAGEFNNNLDPMIRVYNAAGALVASDDNSASDHRNARVHYKVPKGAGGTYYIEVLASTATAEPTSGEYILNVKNATGTLPPFQVAATDPVEGSLLRDAPTAITVDFNDTVLLTTLQASDLTIDGVAAASITVVDGDTVLFALPSPLTDGSHVFRIAAGAIRDIQNTPLQAFTGSFVLDLTPPRIVGISLQEGEVAPAGDLTYTIQFSEPMQTSTFNDAFFALSSNTDLDFRGIGRSFAPTSASFDATGTMLTLQYTGLLDDSYTLVLFSDDPRFGEPRFEDLVGFHLDGEPVAFPIPPNQTGDGVEGGDFFVHFILDIGTVAYPTPLRPKLPLGSLIYDPSFTAFIQPSGDTDSFTLNVDAGQTITVLVQPDSGLQPTIELRDPSNGSLGSASAGSAGQEAILQTVSTTSAGVYTVTVGGAAGSTGKYTVQVILNAALEAESHGGLSNDTLATAQNIEGSFVDLLNTAERGAVLGRTEVITTTLLSADFESGDQGFTVDNTPPDEFHLAGLWHNSVNFRGDQPGHSANHSFYYGQGEDPSGVGTINVGSQTPTSGNLLSPSLTLPTGGTIELDFNSVLDRRRRSDEDSALLQINDGSGWATLKRYTASHFNWAQETMDLTAYAGRTVQLRWQFDTLRGPVGQRPEGWYIDDVTLVQRTPAPDYYAFELGNGQSVTLGLKLATATSFPQRTDYPTAGDSSIAIAYGDLNGDGYADMVSADLRFFNGQGTVTVRLNNGDGTFGDLTRVRSNENYPRSVALGDVNNDHNLDIVLSNSGYFDIGSIEVALGNGDGTFGNLLTSRLSFSSAGGMALADFDGDGTLDVVQTDPGDSLVNIGHGNGNGTFTFAGAYATGAGPRSVAVGDLNGDSHPDLAVANQFGGFNGTGNVSILMNNGNGTFGRATRYFTGSDSTYDVAVGDVNGDLKPDVVNTNLRNSTVSVLLNTGNGTLGAPRSYSTGPFLLAVAIGDVNADGYPDLGTANGGSASVLLGRGDGSFGPPATFDTEESSIFPNDVALVDLNNDGSADLSTASDSENKGTVSVWLHVQSTLVFELLDSTGTTLATGSTGPENLDVVISNFVAPSSGTYYVRIDHAVTAGNDYSLVVTRDAVFDQEFNDTLARAQPMDAAHVALGHVGALGDASDRYSFAATAGESLHLFTRTPADGPGEFGNTLNPHLRLYDPSGVLVAEGVALADGRNEEIVFTAAASGTYTVEVSAEGGSSGEYILDPSPVSAAPDLSASNAAITVPAAVGMGDAGKSGPLTLRAPACPLLAPPTADAAQAVSVSMSRLGAAWVVGPLMTTADAASRTRSSNDSPLSELPAGGPSRSIPAAVPDAPSVVSPITSATSSHVGFDPRPRFSSDRDEALPGNEDPVERQGEQAGEFLDRGAAAGATPAVPMVPAAGEMEFEEAAWRQAVDSCMADASWVASLADQDRPALTGLTLGSVTMLALTAIAEKRARDRSRMNLELDNRRPRRVHPHRA